MPLLWSAEPMSLKDARQYETQEHASSSSLFERKFRARYAVEQHICMQFARARGYACPRYINDVSDIVLAHYSNFLAQDYGAVPWDEKEPW